MSDTKHPPEPKTVDSERVAALREQLATLRKLNASADLIALVERLLKEAGG